MFSSVQYAGIGLDDALAPDSQQAFIWIDDGM